MRQVLVLVLALSGCSSDDGAPSWARATGWFSAFRPADVSCALVGGPHDTELWVSFNMPRSSARLVLPQVAKGERVRRATGLKYGLNGQATGGLIDLSRGDTIIDPRQKDEALRAQSMATGVSHSFPITARRVRLDPRHLCEVNLSDGFVDPNDCIDVPEDSTLEDAHFWCSVGVLTDPAWSE